MPVERLDLDRDDEHRVRRRRPFDVDEPIGLLPSSAAALVQALRCTDTPPPRVTKPRMSSPGTGVQHRASLTQTSVDALDARRRRRPATRAVRRSERSDGTRRLGDVLDGALETAELRHELLYDRLSGDVALADGRVQRGDVEPGAGRGRWSAGHRRRAAAAAATPPCASRGSARSCLRRSRPHVARGRTTGGSWFAPGAT